MPQRETALVGRNNVRAQVTGQEELLVKVNSSNVSPIGQKTMDESLSVTLASDQVGIARTTGMIRPNNIFGDVNTAAGSVFFSVSVANVGAANGSVLGEDIKPGEVLNFSADAINNYFTTFAYDATGTEFIIIFVS